MAKKVAAAGPVEGPWALPDGWRWCRLGDLGEFLNGAAFKPTDWGDVGTPIIRIQNLNNPERVMNRTTRTVNERLLVRAGDLLVSWSATLDAFLWRREDAWLNQHIFKVVPDETIVDRRYMFFLLKNEIENLKKTEHLHGSTMMHINRGPFLAHAVPVPPLKIQVRVAARIDELFTEVDDGEAALARARDDLATWRKALLKAAVTGELTAEWRAANPPAESGTDLLARILADRRLRWESDRRNRGKQYKEPLEADRDTLPAVPKEWTWATAEQVVRKAEYGTSIKCHEAPSGPPVLRMGNIQDGGLDWRKLKYAPENASLPILEAGDVLFNRTNSAELLGKSAVFDGSDSPVSFASYIVAVQLAGVLPHFFSAWMNSIYGRQWIAQNKSQQVGQANLSAGTLMRMEIPVPPIAEQQRIVELIAADRARDDALGIDLTDLAQAATTLRQSILAAAFRGELA